MGRENKLDASRTWSHRAMCTVSWKLWLKQKGRKVLHHVLLLRCYLRLLKVVCRTLQLWLNIRLKLQLRGRLHSNLFSSRLPLLTAC